MAKKIKKARSWGFSSSEQSINNYVSNARNS